MTEQGNNLYCQKEILQPRLQWNLVLKLTHDIANQANKAGINPHNLVFIGGIAIYLHTQKAVGDRVVNRWRGTHDVDLVVTEKGGIGKILSAIQQSKEYEYIEPIKSHFCDKQTWEIRSRSGGYLADKERTIDIDVYFSNPNTNSTNINGREIRPYPENFLTNPVVITSIGGKFRRVEVAIPSVRDCLITKLDVAAIGGKLRHKDRNDILALLMVSEKNGDDAQQIIRSTLNKIEGNKKIKPALQEMKDLFTDALNCLRTQKIDREMLVFIPSQPYIKKCRETVESIQKHLSGKNS